MRNLHFLGGWGSIYSPSCVWNCFMENIKGEIQSPETYILIDIKHPKEMPFSYYKIVLNDIFKTFTTYLMFF